MCQGNFPVFPWHEIWSKLKNCFTLGSFQEWPGSFSFKICISSQIAHFRLPRSSLSRCLLSSLAEYTWFLTRSVQPLVSPSLGLGICFHLLNAVCTSRQGRLLVFASVGFWEASSLGAGCRKHLGPHLSAGSTGGLFFSTNHIVINFSPSLCSATTSPLRHPSPCFLLETRTTLFCVVAATSVSTVQTLIRDSSPSSPGCHYLLDPWMHWQNVWLGVHTSGWHSFPGKPPAPDPPHWFHSARKAASLPPSYQNGEGTL